MRFQKRFPLLYRLLLMGISTFALANLMAFKNQAPRPPAPNPPAHNASPKYAPDRVLVAFKPKASQVARVASVNRLRLVVDQTVKSPYFTRLLITQAAQAAGQNVKSVIAALRKDPTVRVAEPDWIVHADFIPNDPQYPSQYALPKINAPGAWDITKGKYEVKVAVIDTGVDYTHPDLAPNIARDANGDVLGYDFANLDNDPMDDNGHGTHVSGSIGAVGNNALGVAGVNFNVSILPMKFLDASGSGTNSNAILAIDMARSFGAQIMSNSWGGGAFSQLMLEAIQRAQRQGILFVAAAGNDGQDNGAYPHYPASYNLFLDNVISVAATDSGDNLASFSNFGAKSVDIAAPGVDILSTWPGGSYATLSGTSMATPHVSGVAALIKSQYPTLNAIQMKARLLANVDHPATLAGLVRTGRLNAKNALEVDNGFPSAPYQQSVLSVGTTAARLQWRSSGDDGGVGTAYLYELHYSTSPITPANFDKATRAINLPAPAAPGTLQSLTVGGLSPNTTYYFALRSLDDAGNQSSLTYFLAQTLPLATKLSDDAEGTPKFAANPGTTWAVTTEQSHSGTHAYSDSPGGNYQNNTDASLTQITPVTVSLGYSALSFFAKIDLEDGFDFLTVEVSKDGGATWEPQSLTLTGHSDWAYYTLPLTAYAGQTIKVRFRLTSDSSVTYDGVYLDDIAIHDEGTVVYKLSDNVEGTYLFTGTPPWAPTTELYYSPTHSYTDSPGTNYADNQDISLTQTSPLLLTTDFVPYLSAKLYTDLEDGYDFLNIEVSTDNGASWIPLTNYTGSSEGWLNVNLPMYPFSGQSVKVRFRLLTDASVEADGVHVDDIAIVGPQMQNTQPATRIYVTPRTGFAGKPVAFFANLSRQSDGAKLDGKLLTVRLDGVVVGTATTGLLADTGEHGAIRVDYTLPVSTTAGTHTITVEFAGDSSYAASLGAGTLTVGRADTYIYVSPRSSRAGQLVAFFGNLSRYLDHSVKLNGRTLVFKLDGTILGPAVTGHYYPSNEDGVAQFNYVLPASITTGSHTITVEFAGDADNNPTTATGTLTINP